MDLSAGVTFGQPAYLWLLLIPAALVVLWAWRVFRRRHDLRALAARRIVPLRERPRLAGDFAFWIFVVGAISLLTLAIARPQLTTAAPQRAGVDLVVLQDASASMRVADVTPDRWQRSMQFLRELGDALSWREDRIAMTVFAHIATPQVRLTRDPNTYFFFLDHLHARPPFRLEDDTTWDTNMELGLGWGLRLIDKDEEIHGRSPSARAFVALTDGEAWSGEVAKAVATIRQRGIPLFVVGVGTLRGGRLPIVPRVADDESDTPAVSRLDRAGLQRIAAGGGGQYFELDRDGDRYIANTIVSNVRRLAPPAAVREMATDLYWWFLLAGAICAATGVLVLRDGIELTILLAASMATAVIVWPLLT